ncbi:MAG: glycosyltransferase [Gemmatimonadetes bacterium]|nr:glycosyltransferase [Gemmatimonadota bacterium]
MSSHETRAVPTVPLSGAPSARPVAERAGSGGATRADALEAARTLTPATRRDFALVIPAFDEAPMVKELVAELKRAWVDFGLEGEILVVDDGSTDGTAELLEREAADWPRLRVLRHRINEGKTKALLTAAAATNRTWLVLFDADLQHLPDEIPRFLAKLQEGWDIVTGRKVGAYDKRAISGIYNRLSRRIFRVPVSDLNSMKAFRREIVVELHLRRDWHRFFVVLAHQRGWSVTEIDIPLHPRRAGVSKYQGPLRIVIGLLDLLSVWFLVTFSRKPLLFFGIPGAGLILAGLLVGVVSFILRFGYQMGFRPLLTLVLLLEVVGFLLLVTGLLAEMIAQLRAEMDALRHRGPPRTGGS